MSVAAYPKLFILTDAAVNIAPTLAEKADIAQNAIDLARSLGVDRPKVAVLCATESVNPSMPATLDAAACPRWPTGCRYAARWWTGRWRWTTPFRARRRS